MDAQIAVVLAVADEGVGRAVAAALEGDGGIIVIDRVRTRGEAVLSASFQQPDVVLLDATFPYFGAAQATRAIARRQRSAAVALLVDSEDAVMVHAGAITAAIRLGARGYIVRSDPTDELAAAVHELAAAGVAVTPAFARSLLRALFHADPQPGRHPLSADDELILGLRGRGWQTGQIAERMGLSPAAVHAAFSIILDAFRAEQDEPPEMLGARVPRRPLPPGPGVAASARPSHGDTSPQHQVADALRDADSAGDDRPRLSAQPSPGVPDRAYAQDGGLGLLHPAIR